MNHLPTLRFKGLKVSAGLFSVVLVPEPRRQYSKNAEITISPYAGEDTIPSKKMRSLAIVLLGIAGAWAPSDFFR